MLKTMNLGLWAGGMRPRTLPASIAPVIVGAASAYGVLTRDDGWGLRCLSTDDAVLMAMETGTGPCATTWTAIDGAIPRFLGMMMLCMGVALFLQIAVNFANDYSDGVRGTDDHRGANESRTGKPQRLTASGLVLPKHVLAAAGISAVLACLCGLGVAIASRQYWLIGLGALCLIAGWFYTGGRHPYGYAGFGELFVFLFFGLVATLGTEFAICQSFDGFGIPNVTAFDFTGIGESSTVSVAWLLQGEYGIDGAGLLASICVGLHAVMVLMVNNLRDIDDDVIHGKRTLAVRLGWRGAWIALVACCVADWIAAIPLMLVEWAPYASWLWIAVGGIMQTQIIRAVLKREFGRALGLSGMQCLAFAVVVVIGTWSFGTGMTSAALPLA